MPTKKIKKSEVKDKNKKQVNKKNKKVNEKNKLKPTDNRSWLCSCCGTINKTLFYQSLNEMHDYIKVIPICKKCLTDCLDRYLAKYEDGFYAFYLFCRKFDIYFSQGALDGAMKQKHLQDGNLLGHYMKTINSFRVVNGYGNVFDDSTDTDQYKEDELSETHPLKLELEELRKLNNRNKLNRIDVLTATTKQEVIDVNSNQSRTDVLRILGYDPFDREREEDKFRLYTMLVDYLDDNTQRDSFKIPICVQIVKNFNQVVRIDERMANLDPNKDYQEWSKLATAKKDLTQSTLSMAKDNGISANHSNTKSKGAGTLSGILKELREKDLTQAEVNLIDLKTCSGIKQVADISNKSILDQCIFNENDYDDMIKEQRALIQEYRSKSEMLSEELREFKKKYKELIEKTLAEEESRKGVDIYQ